MTTPVEVFFYDQMAAVQHARFSLQASAVEKGSFVQRAILKLEQIEDDIKVAITDLQWAKEAAAKRQKRSNATHA